MTSVEVAQIAEHEHDRNYGSYAQNTNSKLVDDNDDSRCYKCSEWHWFRWLIWGFLLLTSLFLCALSAKYYSFQDSVLGWNHYHKEKFWVYLHINFCFWPMLLGIWQLNGPLRRKYINLHRWFGRIYVICCYIGTIGGLYMAQNAHGGFVTTLSFTMIGVLWILTTSIAVYFIKFSKRDKEFRIKNHRIWMIRSFALMIGVAMFRYWLPLFQTFGYGANFKGEDVNDYESQEEFDKEFEGYLQAYGAASWFCWVFNLCVAEAYMFIQSNYISNK